MSLAVKNHKDFYPVIFSFFVVEGLVSLQLLLNQIFVSQTTVELLNAYSMLIYLCAFPHVIGMALGETCILVSNADLRVHKIKGYFGGAFGLYLLISSAVLFLQYAFMHQISRLILIENVMNYILYYKVWLLIAFFVGLNAFILHFFFPVQRKRDVLHINFLSLSLNLVLGAASLVITADPNLRILLITLSFMTSVIVSTIISIFKLRKYIKVSVRNSLNFFSRCKKIFLGDFLNASVVFFAPLFYSMIFGWTIGGEAVASYNVGIRIVGLFSIALWGIQISGIGWIQEIWAFRGEPEWFHCMKTILKTSIVLVGIPSIALAITFPWTLPFVFNLQTTDAKIICISTVLGLLPIVLAQDSACKVRVFEKQHVRSIINFILLYCFGLPICYLLGRYSNVVLCALGGLILPSTIEAVFLRRYLIFLKCDTVPVENLNLRQNAE